HRLVLDGTEDRRRKAPRLAPRPTEVARRSHHAPPRLRARPNLVEQHQRGTGHVDEDRIPARIARAIRLRAGRDLDRRGPSAALVSREPDPDVRRAFTRAAKPGRDQAVACVDDRRRMRARERCRLEHELRVDRWNDHAQREDDRRRQRVPGGECDAHRQPRDCTAPEDPRPITIRVNEVTLEQDRVRSTRADYRGGSDPTYAESAMTSSSDRLTTTFFINAALAPALVPFCIVSSCRATYTGCSPAMRGTSPSPVSASPWHSAH